MFKIDQELAKQLIKHAKAYLGKELYDQILEDKRDYSHDFYNKLEIIANGGDPYND